MEKTNTVFNVGDEVSWGYNGDVYPGVVIKVTKCKVTVAKLQLVIDPTIIPKPKGRLTRDVPGVSFEAYAPMWKETFTRKQDGSFGLSGVSGGWKLQHGAESAWNPHF